jgi:UDP-GlcNAc3NAcA epimerase
MTINVCTVVGARPQFVKAAAVSAAFAEWNAAGGNAVRETILHTGQHYDDAMSGVFFRQLGIPTPAIDLNIHGGTASENTAAMIVALSGQFAERRPDLVLLYGDTTSTLAATIAAEQLRLPMSHVEAGPRMGNRDHPEEFNRIVADHAARWLFCPSELAADNLRRENVTGTIEVCGDVMLDVVRRFLPFGRRPDLPSGFVLATIHRPQNTDCRDRLAALVDGLGALGRPVLFACHPRTRAALVRYGLDLPPTVIPSEPLDYLSLLGAVQECAFVVTDSGGLPKEAGFLGKRSLTVSSESPWPELISAGTTRVVGADARALVESADWASRPQPDAARPFGHGYAGEKIARTIALVSETP